MPEEIQIRDADGSESAESASVRKAKRLTAETTLTALSAGQAERLSLDEINAKERRFGTRKAMGPPLAEGTSEATFAVTVETAEEVAPIEPLQPED